MGCWETAGVLLAAVMVVESVANQCPSGLPSTSHMDVFNERCYQFVGEERYWTGARDYCSQHGGRLVKIDDPDTNGFIVTTLNALWWRNNGVWIGLNDRNVENRWQWVGTSPYTSEPVQWTNWGSGHPRGVLHTWRDCVRMVRGGGNWLWHETPCQLLNWKYRFICEYEAARVSSPRVDTTTTTLERQHMSNIHRKNRKLVAYDQRGVLSVFDVNTEGTNSALTYLVDALQLHSTDNDNAPVHAAVADNEHLHPADNKWYVVVICIVAVAVASLVGFLLFRRRRRRAKAQFTAHRFDAESTDAAKSTESLDKPSNRPANLDIFSSLHRVKPNVYIPHGTLTPEGSKPYEAVLARNDSLTEDSEVDVSAPSSPAAGTTGTGTESHAYIAMNGNDGSGRYVLADEVGLRTAVDVPRTTERSPPAYENCTEEQEADDGCCADDAVDSGMTTTMTTYDIPRPVNIYSEIPDVDCGIYESLENLKIV